MLNKLLCLIFKLAGVFFIELGEQMVLITIYE